MEIDILVLQHNYVLIYYSIIILCNQIKYLNCDLILVNLKINYVENVIVVLNKII